MAQTKSKAKPKAASKRRSKSSSPRKQTNSSKSTPAATMTHAADKATTAVGAAAGKAKVPLIAGGAALAGVAGGAALGARQARHRRGGLGKMAKGMGALGVQAGHLASDLQRNREATNGNGKHRSPIEIVLEGLTARRSPS